MTEAADLILIDGEVHTLGDPDRTAEALAVRNGTIVRVGTTYEVTFLEGVDTTVIDLNGRVAIPGFIDAHTHLEMLGRYLVHADLRGAAGPAECLDRLSATDEGSDWILGFGFDESTWDESRYLTREDLDRVSEERPVVAFREDMHVASVNSVVLERFMSEMPPADVEEAAGSPTGVLVEGAVDVLYRAIEPDRAETESLIRAAQDYALARGVTGVHEMVRRSHAPAVYRGLNRRGDLKLRVRLNYWADHLDAAMETGLRTDHGTDRLRVGGIKTYTDGSFGGRTAKLSDQYADGDGTGQWVVDPDELQSIVKTATDYGFQLTAHAIGDAAVDAVLAAYEETEEPGRARHRIEHAELTEGDAVDRMADLGVVASVQPNFLKWARDGGLYDDRLGPDRRRRTNRYRDLLDAGVPVAFGSDCMPLDPLFGIHQAVTAPEDSQRLSVTEALRAYTRGGAYAGFDEDRLGTIAVGNAADLVVLEESPWTVPDRLDESGVALTIVDGAVCYEDSDRISCISF